MNAVVVFAIVAFAIVGIAAYVGWKREQERRTTLFQFALSRGWRYDVIDPLGLPDRWPGSPFGLGEKRQASNVIRGSLDGRELLAFDYRYVTSSTDADGDRHETTHRFHVCVMRMPGWLPPLSVTPESVLSRLGQALGADDIELESEDFNRRYRVSAPDAKFACDVLTPRMMELLLRLPPARWRTVGNDLLCWAQGRASTGDIVVRTAGMSEVIGLVPAFVWKDHGYDPGIRHPAQGGQT